MTFSPEPTSPDPTSPDPTSPDPTRLADTPSDAAETGATEAGATESPVHPRFHHPPAPRFQRARNLVGASLIRVLMSFLGMVVASMVVLLALAALVFNVLGAPEREIYVFPVRVAVCAAGIAVAWALRRCFEGDRTGYMPWQWQGGKALLALLIGQAAATVAIGGANLAMVGAGVIKVGGLQVPVTELLWAIPNLIAVSYIMQGIPEEMVWRGYGQTVLAERLNPWLAGAATGIGFGLMHLVSQGSGDTVMSKVLYILSSIALGLACAGVRQLTGSVWAAAGFHGGMHVTNKLMQAWFTSGESASAYHAQGVAMFAVFVVCSLIGRSDTGDRAVDRRRHPQTDFAARAGR